MPDTAKRGRSRQKRKTASRVVTRAVIATTTFSSMLEWAADDVRGLFLSTYTSWAGMVGFAAALAHEKDSVGAGLTYMVACVSCGFVMHAIGRATAKAMFRGRPGSTKLPQFQYSRPWQALLVAVISYIVATYMVVAAGLEEFVNVEDKEGDDLPALITLLDNDASRLLVAMTCSIIGATTGNAVGNLIDSKFSGDRVPRGTLVCNTLFAALALSLNAMTLRFAPYKRSVILQSVAGSFCGAASAFAGHSSDLRQLYKTKGAQAALTNALANLGLAALVFFVALEIEGLLSTAGAIDLDADGVVASRELLAHYGLVEKVCTPAVCASPSACRGARRRRPSGLRVSGHA